MSNEVTGPVIHGNLSNVGHVREEMMSNTSNLATQHLAFQGVSKSIPFKVTKSIHESLNFVGVLYKKKSVF